MPVVAFAPHPSICSLETSVPICGAGRCLASTTSSDFSTNDRPIHFFSIKVGTSGTESGGKLFFRFASPITILSQGKTASENSVPKRLSKRFTAFPRRYVSTQPAYPDTFLRDPLRRSEYRRTQMHCCLPEPTLQLDSLTGLPCSSASSR